MKAPFPIGKAQDEDTTKIGSVPSGNRNVTRIRHDRTLEIAVGLRGSQGKKEGGQLRFCCDYRYLNAVKIKDAYPIPRIEESLSKFGDAKFFTTLDFCSASWQVPLWKKDREKTGFACELGLYQWKRMPFGLCNATATFQRLMAQALTRGTKKYGNLVMCYVDDVVIATPTLEDHIDWLDEVFGCMKRAGLKCK